MRRSSKGQTLWEALLPVNDSRRWITGFADW